MQQPSRSTNNSHQEAHRDHLPLGFLIFLLSESIVFVSFFVTYAILRLKSPHWFPDGVTGLDVSKAALNTAILIFSSVIIHFAESALKAGKVITFRRLWLFTVALGIIFLFGQALEWKDMPFGINAGPVGATFYLLTGFHGLHVLAGVILLLIMYIRSLAPGNYEAGHSGVSAASLFWHFVDIIWIILFLLLYIW
jgi:cytochrome c oxidase subunit 3